jgi:hypothetical protein
VFDAVDIVYQNEVSGVGVKSAKNPVFVVSNCTVELFVRAKLVERISVEWKIEKLFGIIAGGEAMMNELMQECGFPNAAPADECEYGLVFELTSGLIRACKMVEVASLTGRQIEGIHSVFPPRVVIVEGFS